MRLPFKHHTEAYGSCASQPQSLTGTKKRRRRGEAGFMASFWEVLAGTLIVALVFGTIINGYMATALRVEWTGYSLAAQSLGIQTLEQARSATWDISQAKNEITNLTLLSSSWNSSTKTYSGYTTNILDVPYKSGKFVMATNFVTIQMVTVNGITNPAVQMQSVKVDTVWPFIGWAKFSLRYYTNSICTLIAPDNRDPNSLGVGD
jgi:hypothetical protein